MGTRPDLLNAEPSPGELQTVSRATRVLTAFLEQDSWGVSAMARHLGVNKSVAHRLMTTLASAGMLALEPERSAYVLGPTCAALGERASGHAGLVRQARPHLEALQRRTAETVSLCIVRDDEGECVDFVESRQAMRYTVFRGQRFPLNAGAIGKTLLAFGPPAHVDRLIRGRRLRSFTPDTIVAADALRAELERIRTRGYAFSEGEIDEGARSLGVPVWEAGGRLAASLTISAPSVRMLDATLPALVADLTRCADQLSGALGSPPAARRRVPAPETQDR